MRQAVNDLVERAREMSAQERSVIALEMLDSLTPPAQIEDELSWQQELQTRIDDLDSGRVKTIPWSQVRKEMDELLD